MKKFISIILSVILALGVVGVLTGCDNSNKKATTEQMGSRDIYAMSAVSSAQCLMMGSGANKVQTFNGSNEEEKKDDKFTIPSDDELKNISTYLDMFDGFLQGKEQVENSTPSVETDGEEYGKYAFKMSITFPNEEKFIMYYDETSKETNEEVDTDEEGEIEVEVSSTLKGVMIVGDNVFEITGDKEVETEGDEQEMEIQFTTQEKGSDKKIVVKQSYENEGTERELEFGYEIYKNDKLINETTIEWETEDGETELSLVFKAKSDKVSLKNKYSITLKDDVFSIKVKLNKTVLAEFTAKKDGNKYTFTFEGGEIRDIISDILTPVLPNVDDNGNIELPIIPIK